MSIGKNIKAIRKEKGLTQKKLAELSGIAEITIRQYEAEKYRPKVEAVKKLAVALEVSPFDITGIEYWEQTTNWEEITKDAKILYQVSVSCGEDAAQLLCDFISLNETGKQKAADYVSDLAEQPKYMK